MELSLLATIPSPKRTPTHHLKVSSTQLNKRSIALSKLLRLRRLDMRLLACPPKQSNNNLALSSLPARLLNIVLIAHAHDRISETLRLASEDNLLEPLLYTGVGIDEGSNLSDIGSGDGGNGGDAKVDVVEDWSRGGSKEGSELLEEGTISGGLGEGDMVLEGIPLCSR